MAEKTTGSTFTEARVDVPREYEEAVCDYIIENICNGLVLEDEEDSETIGIQFYVPQSHEGDFRNGLINHMKLVMEGSGEPLPEITGHTIQKVEWEEEYRKSIKPVVVGDDVVVSPPWDMLHQSAKFHIVIEPKMAFGTGTHETTRSTLGLIRKLFEPGMSFLDVGCGSGLLAILADKMGASSIKAIDYDPIAVDNCHENFVINKVKTPNEILLGSIEQCDGDQPYDFVAANIIKTTILEMISRLSELTKPGGILVISGLLATDGPDINAALDQLGLNNYEVLPDNEWITYTINKS